MNGTSTVRHLLLAGTVAALTFAAACGGGDDGANHSLEPSAPSFNDADVAFVQMMIPHHQQAVEMATLAGTRANDPQLKEIAAAIQSAQEPEIATMTGWLQSWGVPTTMPSSGAHGMPGMGGSMPGMMSDQEMAGLEQASGVEFDRMFARMMIAHHNGAIQMCGDVKANGNNPDVKALAQTIEDTQAAEVAQLKAILDRL